MLSSARLPSLGRVLLTVAIAGVAALLLAPGGRAADTFPLRLQNCGETVVVERAPSRAITMNQGATEIMLALGLQSRMIGTAYLDDPTVYPPLKKAYATVPVIAKEYPSSEVVLAKSPDFVYGSYASAFDKKAAGTRTSLAARGIASYLSPNTCAAQSKAITWNDVFAEIRQVGRIFGVSPRAEALVAKLEARLASARTAAAAAGKGKTVFWYDSGTKAPYVGACCGAPGLIMRTLGAKNIFESLRGSWKEASWETVVAEDPDVIVLVNASWDTVASKLKVLAKSLQSTLAAVKAKRYVEIPFGSTTPSFRNVDAVVSLAKALGGAGS